MDEPLVLPDINSEEEEKKSREEVKKLRRRVKKRGGLVVPVRAEPKQHRAFHWSTFDPSTISTHPSSSPPSPRTSATATAPGVERANASILT